MDTWYDFWKPNWFLRTYYGVYTWVRTGKWPVRVWRIKWDSPRKIDHQRFQKMYERIEREERGIYL